MEENFWLESWERGSTAFHQQEFHTSLAAHWHKLGLDGDEGVFVPMCGKTRDMLWLREQGHRVLGVELSPLAVESFYAENMMQPSHKHQGAFDISEADGIRIMCGNFFDVTAKDVEGIRGVYDRAALIALPPSMRESYATHVIRIMPARSRMLLITLEYPAGEMEGPPFSVAHDEVTRLYGAHVNSIEMLSRKNTLPANPGLSARGLSELYECIFLIEMR